MGSKGLDDEEAKKLLDSGLTGERAFDLAKEPKMERALWLKELFGLNAGSARDVAAWFAEAFPDAAPAGNLPFLTVHCRIWSPSVLFADSPPFCVFVATAAPAAAPPQGVSLQPLSCRIVV